MNLPQVLSQPLQTWRQARTSLTREARDTLWLLAMLSLVLLPHAPHLPWWCSLSAGLALAWRAYLAWHDAPLPPRWMLALMLVATLAMTWLTHRTLLGREAGITLVVILTTLKCLELRARRDSLVCLYLGFFLILTQFFQGQGIGTAVLMLVSVWGLLTSLVLGQRQLGRPSIREAGKEAARAMLHGLPLMVVLFVLFPRLGPLWSLPRDAQNRTGLSDQLTLGQVAELSQDTSIALRVKFKGAPPPASSLYFRGPTLERFDGRQWLPAPPLLGWRPSYTLSGRPVPYQMTMEPQTWGWCRCWTELAKQPSMAVMPRPGCCAMARSGRPTSAWTSACRSMLWHGRKPMRALGKTASGCANGSACLLASTHAPWPGRPP